MPARPLTIPPSYSMVLDRLRQISRGDVVTKKQRELHTLLLKTSREADCKVWVYFLKCLSYVKIGQATDVAFRIGLLQTGNPTELILIGLIDAAKHGERDLHYRFKPLRIRNEWFLLHLEIQEFLAEHGWRP